MSDFHSLPQAAVSRRPLLVKSLLTGLFGLCVLSACHKAVNPPEQQHYVISGDKNSPAWPQSVENVSEDVRITLNPGAPTPEIIQIEEDGRQVVFSGERHGDFILVPRKFHRLHLKLEQKVVAEIELKKD